MKRTDLLVIILAAGKGTRMKSDAPKVLHRVCGQTLLERSLRAALGLKPARVAVVIGYGEELMRQELARLESQLDYQDSEVLTVVQAEQNGTGHAASVALEQAGGDEASVLIIPGDTPLLETATLENLFQGADADLSLVSGLPESADGFGRIVRDDKGEVSAIVEHRDCSKEQLAITEVNTSVYLVERGLLEEGLSSLTPDNAQGEWYLTDIVSYGVNAGKKVAAVSAKKFEEVAGANTRYELSMLETARRLEIVRQHAENGVTFEDLNAAYIDEGVEIGAESYIGAGSRLRGKTVLGKGVRVEGDGLIENSRIADGAHIKLGCMICDSTVGANSAVGPFAHLRPGSELGSDVKVGNFVETKKAVLADGAKASHLSYIGDTEVGKDANIGAGTITCNYDGYSKFQTVIGEGAFIGSNTALVAPVNIGAGAVVGAGSTISKDVPADALGLERAPQRNVSEWASKRRQKLEKKS